MEFQRFYCGGEFCESNEKLEITNPFNKDVIATTYLAGTADLENAIQKAFDVKDIVANLPGFERHSILSEIAGGLKNERQSFAELISRESGKPIRYALAEVDRSIQSFIVAAEESRRIPREAMSLDWTPAGKGKEGLLRYFPVGIVAGISPFNFPLNLAVHKIAPAIAAGCPIILKPSSSTPLSTLKLSHLIDQTKLPKGALSVLPMDRKTGNQLVTDNRINLLSFTGSPQVGWEMKKVAGRKKVVLELGGNAGVVISKGVKLEEAIPKCVAGAFAYSGQVCIHTQRIYIMNEIFDEFIHGFLELTANLKQGSPLDPGTDVSAMIDDHNAIRVEQWVNEAVSGGASILAGGHRQNSYFEPTVLTNTNPGMKVCCEEIFGPVVIIEKVPDLITAINEINKGCFGLQAGVFTDSIDEMNYAFNHLEVGGVIINDVPNFRVDHMPYGGVKDSGQGREGIKYAMLDMMEPRLLVKNC
jgi:acyl-CoA reductase-like NAD-dependent aldehyde dehydrogenase